MFLLDLTVCLMLTVYFYTGPPYDGTNKERVVLPVASLFRHRFIGASADVIVPEVFPVSVKVGEDVAGHRSVPFRTVSVPEPRYGMIRACGTVA